MYLCPVPSRKGVHSHNRAGHVQNVACICVYEYVLCACAPLSLYLLQVNVLYGSTVVCLCPVVAVCYTCIYWMSVNRCNGVLTGSQAARLCRVLTVLCVTTFCPAVCMLKKILRTELTAYTHQFLCRNKDAETLCACCHLPPHSRHPVQFSPGNNTARRNPASM